MLTSRNSPSSKHAPVVSLLVHSNLASVPCAAQGSFSGLWTLCPVEGFNRSREDKGHSFCNGGSRWGELPPNWRYLHQESRVIAWIRYLWPCFWLLRGNRISRKAFVDIIPVLSQQSHSSPASLCSSPRPPSTPCSMQLGTR